MSGEREDGMPDRAKLPETLPGHWNTAAGQEMAQAYAVKGRAELMMGSRSDLDLANAVFMADRNDLDLIHYQTAAKERIRWLSVQLALASTPAREAADKIVEAGNAYFAAIKRHAAPSTVQATREALRALLAKVSNP